MIENLPQIKLRIRSIAATRRITRAMEMISAAKLNRVKVLHYGANAYFTNLENIFNGLLADAKGLKHPLLQQRESVKIIALCVITSDTGLCGSYNHNVLRAADEFIERHSYCNIRLIAIGKEAAKHFREHEMLLNSYVGLYGRYSAKLVETIAKDLVTIFTSEEADEIYIAHTKFSAALRHKPVVDKFLNIEPDYAREERHILEPDASALLEAMVPKYLFHKMRMILLDAFTAEHSARMLAMKTATDNADELIETLTLLRNKARQFAITKEVLEIAASAEALKEG